jgi:preprotein translocase subunit YajC
MEKEDKILIVVVIFIILFAFFLGGRYTKYKEKKVIETQIKSLNTTATIITTTGNIPIIINNSVIWTPIQNICRGLR